MLCVIELVAGGTHARILGDDSALRYAAPETVRWEQGVRIEATGRTTGITARLPFPQDWPEQQVTVVRTEHDPSVASVRVEQLAEGVRLMIVSIPRLEPGESASARIVFDVRRYQIRPPRDPSSYRIPRRRSSKLRNYLQPSPFIESRDRRIRAAARQAIQGAESDWERVEAIYDWVRANVRYQFDEQIRPAVEALDKGRGDCEELTSLFIALCRASGIPARAVWVPGHCYPEFYLEDAAGEGNWFPCQAAGTKLFGEMIERRPILQKGDRFRVPGKSGWQRYVAETLVAKKATSAPRVLFFRRPVAIAEKDQPTAPRPPLDSRSEGS